MVDQWDANFVDTSQEVILKLLLAANYIDLRPLLMLMSAKVASMVKGLSPDEIRATWNIRNDYTKVRFPFPPLLPFSSLFPPLLPFFSLFPPLLPSSFLFFPLLLSSSPLPFVFFLVHGVTCMYIAD